MSLPGPTRRSTMTRVLVGRREQRSQDRRLEQQIRVQMDEPARMCSRASHSE